MHMEDADVRDNTDDGNFSGGFDLGGGYDNSDTDWGEAINDFANDTLAEGLSNFGNGAGYDNGGDSYSDNDSSSDNNKGSLVNTWDEFLDYWVEDSPESGSGHWNTKRNPNYQEPEKEDPIDEIFSSPEEKAERSRGGYAASQGDYTASKNESSKVATQTIGNQDAIVTDPGLKSQDLGTVKNAALESVEGLMTKSKDKENEEVLEGRKRRDEAEAADKSNKMRDMLGDIKDNMQKAASSIAGALTGEKGGVDFKVGDKSKEQKALDEANKNLETAKANWDVYQSNVNDSYKDFNAARDALNKLNLSVSEFDTEKVTFNHPNAGEQEISKINYTGNDPKVKSIVDEYNDAVTSYTTTANEATSIKNTYERRQQEVKDAAAALKASYSTAKPATETPAKPAATTAVAEDEINSSEKIAANLDELKTNPNMTEAATAAIDNLESSIVALDKATTDVKNNPNDMAALDTWVAAQAEYNKNLDAALKATDSIKETNFNREFATAIAKANDFDITLADGTKTTYQQVATDMAVRSPEIASAMYSQKAANYAANGQNVMAKIESMKANLASSWAGSKLTLNDNRVRNQFETMANLNMRATYAAYNNVINDPNATPEMKSEAKAAIAQANSLKQASAALEASTGFLSGIGGYTDKTYGVTDPRELGMAQKALAATKEFGQVVLGLGVLPGANKAYQEMYYLNPDNNAINKLFGADLDKDGFSWTQEYGNNSAAQMAVSVGEFGTGLALSFNPATASLGVEMMAQAFTHGVDALYGIKNDAEKAQAMTEDLLDYYNVYKDTNGLPAEFMARAREGVEQIENFVLKADEVGNFDDWLEGSGSTTTSNEKFNQALSFDEWLKLIESDDTMREYAKRLVDAKKNNVDEGVNA